MDVFYEHLLFQLVPQLASVRYREVVRSWEGPLWEVPLYS